ncbi:MAG: TolC family protein [Burkholderiaceae bacterium]|nr:TolC family protein [Burkholderiaceae bacterium]
MTHVKTNSRHPHWRPTLLALLLPLAAAAQTGLPGSAPAAPAAAASAAALAVTLPGDELVRQALDRQPAVQQARHVRLAAQHAAGMLSASPHEWTIDAGLQQRRADSGARGNEWSLGLQRTLRLPGKAELDQQLGDAGLREAAAREAVAWQGAARELLDRWLDLFAARAQRTLQERQLALARQSQDTVRRRHGAGDAAQLDVQAALADVADVERQLAGALAAEARALRKLQLHYPAEADALAKLTAAGADGSLPAPAALGERAASWRQRFVLCDGELRAAQAMADRAELTARRVEAERRPDPTVGVRTAAEAYRTERVLGLTLSIPLGGSYREQAGREAWQQAQASRAELDGRQRATELAVQELFADAEEGVQRWALADRAARAGAESARLMQRAHALGEADLQPTLQARRQAIDAQRSALEAGLAAWRATWRLQLDVGELWSLPGAACAAAPLAPAPATAPAGPAP